MVTCLQTTPHKTEAIKLYYTVWMTKMCFAQFALNFRPPPFPFEYNLELSYRIQDVSAKDYPAYWV